MIADLAICEWNPGSNRSVVDPVVAVQRLDMPAATRMKLIEKMKTHSYDDVVSIDWSSIRSDLGTNRYDPDIHNMNFGTGRLCKAVTRASWSYDRKPESAIVYVMDGRAFGYAAACGNLFELALAPAATAPLAPLVDAGLPLYQAGPIGAWPGSPAPDFAAPGFAAAAGGPGEFGGSSLAGSILSFVVVDCGCLCFPVVAAIPELGTAPLTVTGIFMLMVLSLWKRSKS